ncbi:putative short-chain dehydrogenase [Mollisia scopiformis]|uniref:Putative short-chain dehydrogenase n=1 Tax=Mollisia scopiformis TaxID=149040 RepID=A0A194XBH9_MOLSC|nr:putative short-chain dehydrogenase [Mollisia scopiformis]KUJ17519.1 putative short-chain dehydrogenase [Mollisia scopiformis]
MPSPAKNPPISRLSQFLPPWPPAFTDKDIPSLAGKVYIVTGAASGVGYHLAKILYLKGATVYIAARSQARCDGAVEQVISETKSVVGDHGRLGTIVVDLSDFETIRPAVQSFLAKESRLDVLVHNAATMGPPPGSKDKQGNDLEIGTNCLGPYLLTLLLEHLLASTSTQPNTPVGSVRIVWEVSILQGHTSMEFEADGTPKVLTGFMANYMQSKVGVAWLTGLFADRLAEKGVLSVCVHPGLMPTGLQRHQPWVLRNVRSVYKPPINGAYSVLYAGFSPEVTMEDNGGYCMAWGRKCDLPDEIVLGKKSVAEGGSGSEEKFLDFCNKQLRDFL